MTDPVETIAPKELWDLAARGPVRLIDVRTPAEFARVHATGATNVPLDRLDPAAVRAAAGADPTYLICRAGTRSLRAAERLRAADTVARVIVVDGGTLAWRDAGLPLVWGPDPRVRARRIRWAAWALVATSILLAIFVHRGLLGIAAFVGAWAAGVMTRNSLAWRAGDDS